MATRWQKLYKGTPAELSLEDGVAALGVPYRNQFPMYLYGARYFLDFYLPTLGVVIEVDDPSHQRADKMAADEERTRELTEKFGLRVLRCTNEQALADPQGTVRGLLANAGLWPLPARQPRLASALPQPRSCPQRARRELTRASRSRGAGARSKQPS